MSLPRRHHVLTEISAKVSKSACLSKTSGRGVWVKSHRLLEFFPLLESWSLKEDLRTHSLLSSHSNFLGFILVFYFYVGGYSFNLHPRQEERERERETRDERHMYSDIKKTRRTVLRTRDTRRQQAFLQCKSVDLSLDLSYFRVPGLFYSWILGDAAHSSFETKNGIDSTSSKYKCNSI